MTENDARESGVTALEKLAAELGARGFSIRLSTLDGRPPSLTATNPQASLLTETVLTDGEWFWWPWADRIRPVTDVTGAADAIAKVLATAVGGGRS